MRVAFYAPLKAPDHPVPSGDRQLARAMVQALRALGHEIAIASRFRSLDLRGDAARQARLRALGGRLAERLLARYARGANPPQLWLTYHLYHKAPDWLGPPVSRALNIPYVVAEASVAAKQREGPWSEGYADSLAAIAAADAMLVLNPADVAGIRSVRGAVRDDELIPPFLDLSELTVPAPSLETSVPSATHPLRLITVAMMRPGAKLASYRLLAAALRNLASSSWEIVIVGDGPVRGEVEAELAAIDARQVHFVGVQPAARVAEWLRASDLFVWPAIDEAFGIAFIEAQACGLPVIGGQSVGVEAVVAAGRTGVLVPLADAGALAAAIRHLMTDTALRRRMGRAAAAYARERHDLPAAAKRIDAVLQRVVSHRTSRESADDIATPT